MDSKIISAQDKKHVGRLKKRQQQDSDGQMARELKTIVHSKQLRQFEARKSSKITATDLFLTTKKNAHQNTFTRPNVLGYTTALQYSPGNWNNTSYAGTHGVNNGGKLVFAYIG